MNELLRAIPKVTELYDLPEVSDLREHYASSSVTEWIRTVLEQLRSAILSGEVTTLPTLEELGDRSSTPPASFSIPIWAVAACLTGRRTPYTTSHGAIPRWSITWRRAIGEAATTMWKSCCAVSLVPRVPWWSTITPPPSC